MSFNKTITLTVAAVISSIILTGCASTTPTNSPAPSPTDKTTQTSTTSTPAPAASSTPEPTVKLPTGDEAKILFAKIVDKSYQKAMLTGLMEYRSDNTFIGVYDPTVPDELKSGSLDNSTGKYKILRKPDGNFIILSTQMNLVGIDKGYVLPPAAQYSKQGDGTWMVVTPTYTSEGWEVPASTKIYLINDEGLISKVLVRKTETMPAYSIEIFYNVDDLGKNIMERSKATIQQ